MVSWNSIAIGFILFMFHGTLINIIQYLYYTNDYNVLVIYFILVDLIFFRLLLIGVLLGTIIRNTYTFLITRFNYRLLQILF